MPDDIGKIREGIELLVAQEYRRALTPQLVRAIVRARAPQTIARIEDRIFPQPQAAKSDSTTEVKILIVHGVPPSPLDAVEIPHIAGAAIPVGMAPASAPATAALPIQDAEIVDGSRTT